MKKIKVFNFPKLLSTNLSKENDWIQAKSYPLGTGHWYYQPNSYCTPTNQPTNQPLKISFKWTTMLFDLPPEGSALKENKLDCFEHKLIF